MPFSGCLDVCSLSASTCSQLNAGVGFMLLKQCPQASLCTKFVSMMSFLSNNLYDCWLHKVSGRDSCSEPNGKGRRLLDLSYPRPPLQAVSSIKGCR